MLTSLIFRQLFKQIDIASLIFFRIVFGILAFADVAGTWVYKHLYKQSFDPDGFQFRYYAFEWVHPLPEPFMSLLFILTLCASIGILLGWRYRLCTSFFAFTFTYLFLLEKAYYLNHGYLFCVLSFVMIFLPANHQFSLDVFRGKVKALTRIPFWPVFLLQFTMGIVYFFGGVAKINKDWLNAMPLKLWLRAKGDMPILGALWQQEWVAWFMSYGGMLLDLTVVFFLLSRRTRFWALGFVLFFHGTNFILFQIGIFPWLSLALTLMYFEPDFPRRALEWLNKKIPKLGSLKERWNTQIFDGLSSLPLPSFKKRSIILACIFCYILGHLLLPLRHHYFEGSVAWTEEGHRYAWRMMLRSKRGYGKFKVIDKKSGKIFKEDPDDYLDARQERKLYTHPDMILQFAHFLGDRYRENGFEEVAVYADIKTKLNGRPYQRFIDDSVDLTKVEWSFLKTSDWILPLKNDQ